MQVKEIMSKRVTWARPTMTLQEAAKKMRDQNIGCLPVRKDGSLVGMITDRDIVCRAVAKGDSAGKATIANTMSKSVTTCFDDQTVEEAARLFREATDLPFAGAQPKEANGRHSVAQRFRPACTAQVDGRGARGCLATVAVIDR